MKILAVLLVVLGTLGLIYGGVSWTRKDTIVDAGPIQITADKKERLPITPVAGGLILVAGVVLLLKEARA
jgi:UDP-N-acetylmuramyl pentapeptide phosphotransferase/UDP-N-acetylglucosamine-1-phosphate transferase